MSCPAWRNPDGSEIPVTSFRVELRAGTRPSFGEVVLLARDDASVDALGDLRLDAGFSLCDLRVISKETEAGEGGSLIRLRTADRRSDWRERTIFLRANVLRPEGDYDPETLKNGRPWKWRELLQHALTSAGETLLNLSTLPEEPVTMIDVDWTGLSAADVLERLLWPAGYTLVVRPDGALEAFSIGEARARTSPPPPVLSESVREHASGYPEAVEVECGRLIRKVALQLEPVAADVDGSIRPLEDVSYLRGRDVGVELACGFASLQDDPGAQALARFSVGHLFKVPSRMRSVLPLLLRSPCGEEATLSGPTFSKARKSGFINHAEALFTNWRMLRPDLLWCGRTVGSMSRTDTDFMPAIVEKEAVRVEVGRPTLKAFAVKRDASGTPLRWRATYGSGRPLRLALGAPDVVPSGASEARARALADRLSTRLLSVGPRVAVTRRRYAGAVDTAPDGRSTLVRWRGEDGVTVTEVEDAPASLDWSAVCEAARCVAAGAAVLPTTSVAPAPEELLPRLISANKAGVLPLVSDADEAPPLETRLAGRLLDYREEHAAAEISDVAPFEPRNFKHRRHAPDDDVWAVRLVSDDRYLPETSLNRSTPVMRSCDDEEGDLDDAWRVRAIPDGGSVARGLEQEGPTQVPVISTLQAHRLMWLINTTTGGEGGWLTDVPPEGMGLRKKQDEPKRPAPPRHIAQIGDIVVLTDDDTICTTRDGDAFTRANVRHDAHFHLDKNHDGRIRFTSAAPGTRPSSGWLVIGEMVCDPSLANQDTAIKKESGQWCPQLRLNTETQPVYPLGDTLQVDETPQVCPPLAGVTNSQLSDASLADALKAGIDALNGLKELLNGIFQQDEE